MKVTIKAGEIEFTVEHEAQEPHPRESWYSINMLSFTESIQACMKEAAEQIIKMQKELYGVGKPKIEPHVTTKDNITLGHTVKNTVCQLNKEQKNDSGPLYYQRAKSSWI